MKIRWYHLPILLFGGIFTFAAIVFVLMGVDLFPGYEGGRWILLGLLTVFSGLLWVGAGDNN